MARGQSGSHSPSLYDSFIGYSKPVLSPRYPTAVPVPGGGCGTFTLLGSGDRARCSSAHAGNLTKEYVWSARLDHNFSDKDRMFVTVQRDNGTQPTYTRTLSIRSSMHSARSRGCKTRSVKTIPAVQPR
jgi:hypothetical protein